MAVITQRAQEIKTWEHRTEVAHNIQDRVINIIFFHLRRGGSNIFLGGEEEEDQGQLLRGGGGGDHKAEFWRIN